MITFFNVLYGFSENVVGIGNGYTAMQGINMYLIGYFCGKHKDKLKLKKRHYGLIYTICSLIIGFGTIMVYEIGIYGGAWKLFQYNNPLIIVSSINFCMIFVKLRFNGSQKLLNALCAMSSYSLVAYLITDNKIAKIKVFGILNMLLDSYSGIVVESMIIFYMRLVYLASPYLLIC